VIFRKLTSAKEFTGHFAVGEQGGAYRCEWRREVEFDWAGIRLCKKIFGKNCAMAADFAEVFFAPR
jgi:hypothetical protein